MAEITFRDFAGALMGNDHALAATHLQTLLGVDEAKAKAGVEHFSTQMKANPEFMMKAMGMRNAVTSGDRVALVALLVDCFALGEEDADKSADVVVAHTTKS